MVIHCTQWGLPWWLNGKESACQPEMPVQYLGWEDILEKEMANCASILAWEIAWTEEPGGLHCPWGHKG